MFSKFFNLLEMTFFNLFKKKIFLLKIKINYYIIMVYIG